MQRLAQALLAIGLVQAQSVRVDFLFQLETAQQNNSSLEHCESCSNVTCSCICGRMAVAVPSSRFTCLPEIVWPLLTPA